MADSGRDSTCNGPGLSRQELGGVDLQQVKGPALQLGRLREHRKS